MSTRQSTTDLTELKNRLAKLTEEHRDLDEQVDAFNERRVLTAEDKRKLSRLRKKKLMKKDNVAHLNSQIRSIEHE